MDQTPLAFDFLSTRTYDAKGSKTIWVKESRSGWDKRQATLQVCVYADGVNRCKPLLIFIGAVARDSRRVKEERRYAKDVEVVWNPKAWCNKDIMLAWLKGLWTGSSQYPTIGPNKEPRFLCLNAFKAHLTPAVRSMLKEQKTNSLSYSRRLYWIYSAFGCLFE